MIKGLVPKLAVAFKASIGIPAADGKNYPEKLDHFRIVAKNEKGDWMEDPVLNARLQELYTHSVDDGNGGKRRSKLREFDLVFLADAQREAAPDGTLRWNFESVFRTELAWWVATERKCFGDGEKAFRSFSALSDKDKADNPGARGIPWSACGDGCPQYEKGDCKPTGVLSYIFRDHPVVGSIAQFKTTSYETIGRILGSLNQICDLTGGRLRGIPFKAVLRPGPTKYDGPDGKKKKGIAYFVNIEFRQGDYEKLVPQLISESVDYARNVSQARQLPAHVAIVDDEPEIDDGGEAAVAREMTSEFYPDNREKADAGQTQAGDELQKLAASIGLNVAQVDALKNKFGGNVDAAKQWLNTFAQLCADYKKTPAQIKEIFGKALVAPTDLETVFKPKTTRKAATPAAQTTAATAPAQTSTLTPGLDASAEIKEDDLGF